MPPTLYATLRPERGSLTAVRGSSGTAPRRTSVTQIEETLTAIAPVLATAPCTRTGSARTRRTHPPRAIGRKGQPRRGDPTNSPGPEPRGSSGTAWRIGAPPTPQSRDKQSQMSTLALVKNSRTISAGQGGVPLSRLTASRPAGSPSEPSSHSSSACDRQTSSRTHPHPLLLRLNARPTADSPLPKRLQEQSVS